jgi:23S rRNA pseudouridine2605 synthase
MLNKPRRVLSTVRDTHARATVVDLLPDDLPRLFPVGRLDRDTEGLLLLTNDGELAHALLHPSFESEREYRVTVKGRIAPGPLRQLAAGVRLGDGVTAPARVGRARYDAASDTSRFTLTLIEGKKRQIRRSLAALKHPVVGLLRVRMGPLRLGSLASSCSRSLNHSEIETLNRVLAKARRKRKQPHPEGRKQS